MREIKFRAWDKNVDDMIYNVLPLSDGTFLVENANSDKNVDMYPGMDDMPPNTYVLMQYTNSKDRNDKEIYEGDVQQQTYNNGHGNVTVNCEVIFGSRYIGDSYKDERMSGFYLREISNPLNPQMHNSFSIDTDKEIIGNIYDNPELLK